MRPLDLGNRNFALNSLLNALAVSEIHLMLLVGWFLHFSLPLCTNYFVLPFSIQPLASTYSATCRDRYSNLSI